ncbi:MAG: MBL fold metallo-hydrolase [Polyangiaceae bacterium]
MEFEFLGGAGEVTGSKHVLRTEESKVLLDCGLFQGRRRESNERNRTLGLPTGIDAVVLSHAHIDHSGALPVLVKQGYRGPIFATPATRDLCAAMLSDSAFLQAADARYINKIIERDHVDMLPVEPLYTPEDVEQVLRQMVSLPYGKTERITRDVTLTFRDAGHVLGSALSLLDVDDVGEKKRILYTGDLGRTGMPLLRPPEVPSGVSLMIMESTYGDRDHAPMRTMDDALAKLVHRVHARGGTLVIPTFALERAQEVLFVLARLLKTGAIPQVRVFVDSPLAVRITEIFKLHPECLHASLRENSSDGFDTSFDFPGLTYVSDADASKALDQRTEPSIILAGSGMCEGGRVVHHLRAFLESDRNAVAIVGFQAQHTLGRRLAEGRDEVRIFGVPRKVRADIAVLDGFSAHAGQSDLVAFAEGVRDAGPLRQVVLVHGESAAQQALAKKLDERHFPSVTVPPRFGRLRF